MSPFRRILSVIALGAAIVALAVVLYDAWLGEPAPPVVHARGIPPPPVVPPRPEAPAPRAAFELAVLEGKAAIRRGNVWHAAVQGERLLASDVIRTEPGGAAILRSPEGDELVLRERVELEIETLETTVTRLALARGKVRAAAGRTAPPMEIRAGEAEAKGGAGAKFSVYKDPKGSVAVASQEGQVSVRAQGEEVTVPPSRVSYVAPGQTPRAPVAIPDDVFLSVRWPLPTTEDPAVFVQGDAPPGTIIVVNGEEASIEPGGRFRVRVGLKEGPNTIEVLAEGMDGKTERRARDIVRRIPYGPPLEADPSRLYDLPRPK